MHLPGNLTYKVGRWGRWGRWGTDDSQEIEEMIVTVDKNKDGKINYSEFRVIDGFHSSLHSDESPIDFHAKPKKMKFSFQKSC